MVKSKLNTNINYHEYSHLEEEDFNYNTPLFQVQLLRDPQKVVIGLGQLNYHFAKRYNVVYAPIYLFNTEMEFMKQIGVYEMPSGNVKMDESGDLDIHKLTPLLYGFVNTELLRKSRAKKGDVNAANAASDPKKRATEVNEIKKSLGKPPAPAPAPAPSTASADADGDNTSSDDDDTADYDATFGLDARQKHLLSGASILPLQTKEQSELERRQYKPNPASDLWIQKYLRNKYFNFIDNEGASDAFFAVIRDALLTQGRTMTILELRKQLSEEVTEEVFRYYREKFALYQGLTRTQTKEVKELVGNYNDVKRRISSIHDRAQQQLMIAGAKKLVIEHNLKQDEMKYTKLLSSRYDYMREVRNVQQLKERMMTSIYWPDAWAIATMERVLNMKFVIFSRDAYEAGDIDNVLLCDNGAGNHEDNEIICQTTAGTAKGVFEPTAYILVGKGSSLESVTGGSSSSGSPRSRSPRKQGARTMNPDSKSTNYTLITYKTHGVLAFSELPYDIKLLITTKCLENQTCGYTAIPQFRLFQRELGILVDDIPNESLDDLLEEIHTTGGGSGGARNPANLYTNDIVFQFYAKSNPNALPGTGPGERIPETEKIHFHKLSSFDNWRRKLSNFWNEPFMLDGHTWQSVEHYYQGSKFKNNNREFYLKFSLDSRSELSADPVLAKAAGSKSGKLDHRTVVRPSRITIDPDFFNHGRSEREMENAMFAKFSQNKNLKDLLLATRNAKLVQYQRGARPEVYQHLMRVRHKLRTGATR